MDDNLRPQAHLVGVCGSGMKALAELLFDQGCAISGSDLQLPGPSIKMLIERGLVFNHGHDARHLPDRLQQLIYSSAVPAQNPERQEAARRGIPELSFSQMVGTLMRASTGVCIAGTHGKSTTTAMTASILDAAGRLSSAVLGAELCENGRSAWVGVGDLFAAESCEFQRSFLDYHPRYAAILNIEPDHFDCYANLDEVQQAFQEFADQISVDGVLLFNNDNPAAVSVAKATRTAVKRVSYGIANEADWNARDCQASPMGMRFVLCQRDQRVIDIELKLHGMHNVYNALAAAALCCEIGVPPYVIQGSLARFQGIRRRCEFLGEWNGVTLIDDYAHHPTAVRMTLETLRKLYAGRRIWCVFQPHQISRTTALIDEFSESFGEADEVLLAPVYAARESVVDEPQQISSKLAQRLISRGISAQSFASLDQIVTTLEDSVRPGDVIVTMGAGDIDRIHHDFTRRVQRDSAAG